MEVNRLNRRIIRLSAAIMLVAVVAAGYLLGSGLAVPTDSDARPDFSPVDHSAAGSLAGKIIVIDPGHNGANGAHPNRINRLVPAGGFRKACDTTGTTTIDGRLTEAAFNWDVAKRLRRQLIRRGAEVVLTRHSNRGVGPCVNRRAAAGNRVEADLAVSIHADGGPPSGRGFHVIRPIATNARHRSIIEPSKRLAVSLRDALRSSRLTPSDYLGRRGIDRRSDLGGLNLSSVPKVFVEMGNMRNAADARRLKNKRWREHAAGALRRGIARFVIEQ